MHPVNGSHSSQTPAQPNGLLARRGGMPLTNIRAPMAPLRRHLQMESLQSEVESPLSQSEATGVAMRSLSANANHPQTPPRNDALVPLLGSPKSPLPARDLMPIPFSLTESPESESSLSGSHVVRDSQTVANRTLFGSDEASESGSSFYAMRLARKMRSGENGESLPKRMRANEQTSSSSSSSNSYEAMLPPPPRLAQGLPKPIALLPVPIRPTPNPIPSGPKQICPETPGRVTQRDLDLYKNTPYFLALKELRAKIASAQPFSLNTSEGEVLFTIERKIDPAMGQNADVYIGFFVDANAKRIPSVLKIPKDNPNVSPQKMLTKVVHQIVLQAKNELDEVLRLHVPKYYNFGGHTEMVHKIYNVQGVSEARKYIQNQPDLAYQLAEYIPNEFLSPEKKSNLDFHALEFNQFENIVKRCLLKKIVQDFGSENIRVRSDGTVVIIDNHEFQDDDVLEARFRSQFMEKGWKFSAQDRDRLLALVEKAASERVPLLKGTSNLESLSEPLNGDFDEKEKEDDFVINQNWQLRKN